MIIATDRMHERPKCSSFVSTVNNQGQFCVYAWSLLSIKRMVYFVLVFPRSLAYIIVLCYLSRLSYVQNPVSFCHLTTRLYHFLHDVEDHRSAYDATTLNFS